MDDRPGGVRVFARWGDEDRRPDIPWVGIFLVVFGGLLILDRVLPDRSLGNVLVLAAGIASLVAWGIRRSTFFLYAGAFLTAAAIPGTLRGLGYEVGTGWGTVAFGLAFLFVAVVGAARGGGWGWQVVLGAILLALGASEIAVPDVGAIIPALILIAIGLILLTRPRRSW